MSFNFNNTLIKQIIGILKNTEGLGDKECKQIINYLKGLRFDSYMYHLKKEEDKENNTCT